MNADTMLSSALEACALVGAEGAPEKEIADAAERALEAVSPEDGVTFGVCLDGAPASAENEYADPVLALEEARRLKADNPDLAVQILVWGSDD